MERRDVARARADEQAFRDDVRSAAGTSGAASELAGLADLRDRGVLTEEELQTRKAELLA